MKSKSKRQQTFPTHSVAEDKTIKTAFAGNTCILHPSGGILLV